MKLNNNNELLSKNIKIWLRKINCFKIILVNCMCKLKIKEKAIKLLGVLDLVLFRVIKRINQLIVQVLISGSNKKYLNKVKEKSSKICKVNVLLKKNCKENKQKKFT